MFLMALAQMSIHSENCICLAFKEWKIIKWMHFLSVKVVLTAWSPWKIERCQVKFTICTLLWKPPQNEKSHCKLFLNFFSWKLLYLTSSKIGVSPRAYFLHGWPPIWLDYKADSGRFLHRSLLVVKTCWCALCAPARCNLHYRWCHLMHASSTTA